jgi:hypothetical protein
VFFGKDHYNKIELSMVFVGEEHQQRLGTPTKAGNTNKSWEHQQKLGTPTKAGNTNKGRSL